MAPHLRRLTLRPMARRLTLHLLLHSARLIEGELRASLERIGLSHEQARYLDALFEHGQMAITALAHGLGLSQPAATTMVRRLIADRRVAIAADPEDGRSSLVALTDRGVRAARAAREVWLRAEHRLGAGGGSKDLAQLHRGLSRLLDRLGGRPPTFRGRPAKRASSGARRKRRAER